MVNRLFCQFSDISFVYLFLIDFFLGLLFFLCFHFFIRKFFFRFKRSNGNFYFFWQAKGEDIFLKPLYILMLDLLAIHLLRLTEGQYPDSLLLFYAKCLCYIILVLSISGAALRWIKVFQDHLIKQRKILHKDVDLNTINLISRFGMILVFLVSALMVLQIIGVNILPLLAFGGIGAASLGFSAKDMISNFFGGLMLNINRSFLIGDQIGLPEKSLEGTVIDIGWSTTTLIDKEKRPIYLPNSIFSTFILLNFSRMSHRRILEVIKISFVDISILYSLIEEIKKEIAQIPTIDSSLPLLTYLDAVNGGSLAIYVELYTTAVSSEKYVAIKQEVLLCVYKIIQKQGGQIAIPIMNVLYSKKSLS
ncbi:MAG: mechanosensitive ion channel family protein [Rhabdochlamydiaceae bacterium]